MAVIFLYVDQATNNILNASYDKPTDIPNGQVIEVVESTIPHAVDALQNPQNYFWSNGILPVPSVELSYASGTVTATILNPKAGMTTAPISLQVCGKEYTMNMSGLTGTLDISIHASVQNFPNAISATAPECIGSPSVAIGGTANPQVALQSYLDGSTIRVAPTGGGSIDFLCEYWTSTIPQLYLLPDLATIVNMLADTVYGKILPALSNGQTPMIALNADEQNALNDFNSYITPKIPVTLANAAPVPAAGQAQTYSPHYNYLREHEDIVTAAMRNFANDLNTIPNLM